MRLTVEECISTGVRARVWVDGIERSGVVEANEEGRYAVIHRRDESGRYVLTDDGKEVATDVLRGEVRIELCQ